MNEVQLKWILFCSISTTDPSPTSRWQCQPWATTRWWTCWRRRWWWPWQWSLPTQTDLRGEAARRTTVCSVWVARGTMRTWRAQIMARSTGKLPLYRPLCLAAIGGGWICSYQCYTVQRINLYLSLSIIFIFWIKLMLCYWFISLPPPPALLKNKYK